jgi:hypothetical protein
MNRRQKSKQLRGEGLIMIQAPQKRDYTHTIIIALSSILAAYIVSRK